MPTSPLHLQESCSHTLGLPDCSLLADKKARASQRTACLSEKAVSVSVIVSESLAEQTEGKLMMSLPSYSFPYFSSSSISFRLLL
jgi:hypothetical protein